MTDALAKILIYRRDKKSDRRLEFILISVMDSVHLDFTRKFQ